MTNLINSIMSYNTQARQLSELNLTTLSLFGTGNFSDIFAETYSVKTLKYYNVTEDESQNANALFDLANQITKSSTKMTYVEMTLVEFEASQIQAIV